MAHTSGDAYVHFKSANVIAVGDVASPVRDPELDWFTGGPIDPDVVPQEAHIGLGAGCDQCERPDAARTGILGIGDGQDAGAQDVGDDLGVVGHGRFFCLNPNQSEMGIGHGA